MKKTITKIALCLTAFAFAGSVSAQSQRLVLVEEFTQASCPPCAAQNPGFNTLLNSNSTKVVAIKHQVWWPGFDPMYNQNTTDINTRVAYYGVSGVPYGRMDGTEIANDCGYYAGAPACLNQTEIDNEYAVSSPFTINLTHTFNANYDSMFVSCEITCSQAVTGTLMARVAIIERDIFFTTQPGTNGETHFEGVMKKYLPDADGTSLAASWTVGQTQTLTFAVATPWYTYDLNNLAVVAYVQDDANQSVLQAGYSAPLGGIPTTNDAGVTTIASMPFLNCSGTVSPTVTIKNFATGALTSCDVSYQIDNDPPVVTPWTGSLNLNQTATVSVGTINFTPGIHNIKFFTTNPNAAIDFKPQNNFYFGTANVINTYSTTAVTEGFQGPVYPSPDWGIFNPGKDKTWTKINGYGGFVVGASESSSLLEFYSIQSGYDEMYLPGIDLSTAWNPQISFDVAYCQYQAENDKLEVLVSTNCGTSWTSAYNKAGTALMTAPPQTGGFAPNASQWRTDVVSLNQWAGNPNVIVKFKGTSNYGNNLWLDNINLTQVTAVKDNPDVSSFAVYPSPAKDRITLAMELKSANNCTIQITDALGKIVLSQQFENLNQGFQTKLIDIKNLSTGLYSLNVQTESGIITRKFVKE